MQTRPHVRIVSAFLALMLLLIAATPALADPPEQETTPISETFVLAVCDGFDVMDTAEGTRYTTKFYDQDGNLERVVDRNRARDWIWNSETGFGVWSRWANNVTYYAPFDQPGIINGVGWNVTVPGYGAIWFNAGHSVYDPDLGWTSYGNHSAYAGGEDELCEAMDQEP